MRDNLPTRSVTAGALGGALTTVVVSVLEMNDVHISAELSAAICTLVMALITHFTPDKVDTRES